MIITLYIIYVILVDMLKIMNIIYQKITKKYLDRVWKITMNLDIVKKKKQEK